MKLDSSTLFVNTGRKAMPAMQKKKKSNKNTVALMVCIAIIAVLCVFVGLIAYVWVNYNSEVKPQETQKVSTEVAVSEKQVEEKPETEEKEEVKPKTENKTKGKKTTASKAATKAFDGIGDSFSFAIVDLGDGYTYISNTDKIYNSAALGAYLMDYVSNAIYMGSFDYTTNVSGYTGDYLMNMAFSGGDAESANLLISHFGVDRLNAYLLEQGYSNTHFGGTIGSGEESYTTEGDLIKLMQKMYDNTTFFPYSDMYQKMLVNTVDNKISAKLNSKVANISFESDGELFDAAVVYTESGNFIFISTIESSDADEGRGAISEAALGVYNALKGKGGASE